MPGGDRTGPMGFGAGLWGMGGGRGRRNVFYSTGLTGWPRAAAGWPSCGTGFRGALAAPAMSREHQLETLKERAEYLEGELDAVNKRMEELSAAGSAREGK